MIKVIYGPKGIGKTKVMVDRANILADEGSGDVVFIDNSNELIYDLRHEIRFANISEYPITNADSLIGFICGVVSQDYDIECIFIDGLLNIVKNDETLLESFFKDLERISSQHGTRFQVSVNGEEQCIPEYMKKYAV